MKKYKKYLHSPRIIPQKVWSKKKTRQSFCQADLEERCWYYDQHLKSSCPDHKPDGMGKLHEKHPAVLSTLQRGHFQARSPSVSLWVVSTSLCKLCCRSLAGTVQSFLVCSRCSSKLRFPHLCCKTNGRPLLFARIHNEGNLFAKNGSAVLNRVLFHHHKRTRALSTLGKWNAGTRVDYPNRSRNLSYVGREPSGFDRSRILQ